MQIVQDNLETLLIRGTILETLRNAPGKRFRLDAVAKILGTGIASVRAVMSHMVIENHIRSERDGRLVSYYVPTEEQLAADHQRRQLARPFRPYRHDSAMRDSLKKARAVRALGESKF
jgi:hypothetical protein